MKTQDTDELRMEGFVDPLGDGGRNGLDARVLRDLQGDTSEQALGIVAFTEEPAIQTIQPVFTAKPDDDQRQRHRDQPRPLRSEQRRERVLPIDNHIDNENRGERRDQGVDKASGQRVSQSLPKDDPDVEQAVTQDGVRE